MIWGPWLPIEEDGEAAWKDKRGAMENIIETKSIINWNQVIN